MKLYSIASGSNGNAIYVESHQTKVLVDVGISKKRIEDGLKDIQVDPAAVDAILITHEHSDHIKGLGVMLRKYPIPVYATEGTIRQILKTTSLGKFDAELLHCIQPGEAFTLGDLTIRPIAMSHDAAQPVAYRIENQEQAVGILTDLGTYDGRIIEEMKGLGGILVEANHDIRMLQVGSYPYQLKQRILGNYGHLSNEASAQLLCSLIHDKMKVIMLGHLSHENNLAELAYETVCQEIAETVSSCGCHDLVVEIATRDHPSALYEI